MADWNHRVCANCYDMLYPGREPHRLVQRGEPPIPEKCCFCGHWTLMGIYVRHDPKSDRLRCKGNHDESRA